MKLFESREERKARAKFAVRKGQANISRYIQSCAKAREKYRELAKRALAYGDERAHKAECKALQHDRQNLMKTRMLSQITVRKLERFGGKKQKDVFKVIEKVFDDEVVKNMVDDANIRAEEFSSRLDRLLDVEIQRLDDQTSANRMETTEAQQLFRQLADATEKGDVERVKAINKQLTGEENTVLTGAMEPAASA